MKIKRILAGASLLGAVGSVGLAVPAQAAWVGSDCVSAYTFANHPDVHNGCSTTQEYDVKVSCASAVYWLHGSLASGAGRIYWDKPANSSCRYYVHVWR